jgi:hypothetical protein
MQGVGSKTKLTGTNLAAEATTINATTANITLSFMMQK